MWPYKPEVLISPTVWQISLQFRRKLGVFDRGPLAESVNKWLQYRTLTGNSDMATKTGNSYTTGTTTDSVEIPTASPGFSTMAARIKCRQVIATMTDHRKWQCRRFGRQSCNIWWSIVVAIIWLIFFSSSSSKVWIWRWNFDAICNSSRDVSISGLWGISIFPVAVVLTFQHYFPPIHGLKP